MARSPYVTPSTNVDWKMAQALNEIFSNYGDAADVIGKAKSLLKFGENDDLAASTWETVWEIGDDETYVSTNIIDTISSSDAGDTQTINIEGHTVTGTGANQQFTFVVQEVTLNGQNKVTLTTPLARVSRAANDNGTTLLGDVYVYEDTAISGGVPTDITKAHIKISGASEGYNQSFKAATTFSNTDYFILSSFGVSITKGKAAAVDFELQLRAPGGIFLPKVRVSTSSTGTSSEAVYFDPYIVVPKNNDIRIRANSDTLATPVNAYFQGYIAQVVE